MSTRKKPIASPILLNEDPYSYVNPSTPEEVAKAIAYWKAGLLRLSAERAAAVLQIENLIKEQSHV